MTTNETTDRNRRTERWTPARLFRSTFALVFGLLAALVLVVGLLYLLFGPGGGETLGEDVTVDEVVVEDVVEE
jgi:hypothetical protein